MTERVSVTDSGVDVADDVRDGYLDRVVTRTLTWIALTLVSCVVWFAIAVCSGWAVNLPVVVGLTCAGLLGSHLMVRRAPHVRGTWLDSLLVIGLQGLGLTFVLVVSYFSGWRFIVAGLAWVMVIFLFAGEAGAVISRWADAPWFVRLRVHSEALELPLRVAMGLTVALACVTLRSVRPPWDHGPAWGLTTRLLAFACLVVALGTLLARGHRTSREIPASRPTEAAILLTDGILNVYFALMVVGLPI